MAIDQAKNGRSPSGRATHERSRVSPSPPTVGVPNAAYPSPGKAPCGTCPYRKDVPAGVWHPSEYAKLPGYDGETFEQSAFALFFCHQQDGHLCAGWVGCHDPKELLAVRLNPVAPETFGYKSPVPLFASGAAAAAHGLSGVVEPDRSARHAIEKLGRKRSAIATAVRMERDALAARPKARARAEGIAKGPSE